MVKKPIQIRASDRTVEQIAALAVWWNCTNTDVVQESVSHAWAREAARRGQYTGAPWIVRTDRAICGYFGNEEAAIRWLELQGAQRTGADEWCSYDVSDETSVFYDVVPLRFTEVGSE